MSENTRKSKPPKRKESTDHGKQSQLSSKHLKTTSKTCSQLKTTLQIIQEFENTLSTYLRPEILFNFHPKGFYLPIPTPRFDREMYSSRYFIFAALSKHVFPILSLPRHYFNTLEKIEIMGLCFNPFKTKDLEFLGELFNLSALLPNLKYFELLLRGMVNICDFEGWGLLGLSVRVQRVYFLLRACVDRTRRAFYSSRQEGTHNSSTLFRNYVTKSL